MGRAVSLVYENGYLNTRRMFAMTLLKGFITGLGGVVGATLGIGIFIWLLSLFGEIPLIGNFFDVARDTIAE